MFFVVVLKQAKEAKRSKITKKSLQEFLADSEPQEENRKGSEEGSKVKEDCEGEDPRARTTGTEENEMEIQQENHPEAAEGSEVRDCSDNTAGTKAIGNEEKEEQQKRNSGMSEAGDGCGPLQPSDEDQPCAGDVESLADELAAIKVADGCQNSTSCEQESCQHLDGSKEIDEEGVSDSVALFSGESVKNATESGIEQVGTSQHLDSQPEEPPQGATSSATSLVDENTAAQSFQVDSLQACLKKFCSPELLTGNNKFACTFCTKAKEVGKNELQYHMSTSSEVQTTTEDMVEVSTEDKEEEESLPQQPETHSLVTPPNSTNEQESEKAGSSVHEHAEEPASEVSDNQFEEKSNEERTDAGDGGVLTSEGSCRESSHKSGKESDGKNFVLYYATMHAYACYSFLHQMKMKMKMMCPRRRRNDIKRKRANWFFLKPQSSC